MESGILTCTKHPTQHIKQNPRTKTLYCPQCRRNAVRRETNQMLSNLCGTSARAAREDMGL